MSLPKLPARSSRLGLSGVLRVTLECKAGGATPSPHDRVSRM